MNNYDAEIAAFKKAWAERASQLTQPPSLEEQRRTFDEENSLIPLPAQCAIEEINSDGVSGERLIPKGSDERRAILYHHGGGHTFGSPRSHRHLVGRLAEAAGVTGFNMFYRLAPEHPYPAGLDDAICNYRFLLEKGFAAEHIVVAGESAGGNLTAALLLKLRELGLPLPTGAYLLSPWLDMTQSGEAYERRAPYDPMLTRDALENCAIAYCSTGASRTDPFVSPAKANLAGLPPLLIQVGTDELLLSDSLDFARRAALEGLDVQLQVWRGMVHAWPLFHPMLPTAGLGAIRKAGTWIAEKLASAE
jgi:acetyl esterase/lipase